ncbi:MAG: hypothetical protein JJU06_03510 [Ectothiorhodospiraceae bacterium]|nr:hypothetical protein [Ectothiorhodospiraceae bacterium]MCH8506240.1 hypothetical protein [Ectothiorhodospiraceae bacterium]
MIVACELGRRSHRQPFAYPAIRQMCEGWIRFIDKPADAELLLFAHPDDLTEAAESTWQLLQRSPGKRVVLLSEEPFWDTIWGAGIFERVHHLELPHGHLPYTYLNHHTSSIYRFERVPYYLLTDHRFFPRYARRFQRNAGLSAREWGRQFDRVRLNAAFIAEHRSAEKFDVSYPERDVYGLAAYRTRLAAAYDTGEVVRQGRGWQKGLRRQELIDWHLDKLQRFDMQCRFVSAIENTHQLDYVSEKFFDAFAMGAIPLYLAAPAHSVHRIACPKSWLNLFGIDVPSAVEAISGFSANDVFLNAYAETQHALANLFRSPRAFVRERERLAWALREEFTGD